MIAVDSSVIVAALLSWHEKHEVAARALGRALDAEEGIVIPVHAIVESYSVLTRLPPPHRLAASDALALLRENFQSLKLAAFSARSVWTVLGQLSAANLGGGVTYDAMILHAAVQAGATSLLTLNARDYGRLPDRLLIVVPA